MKMFIVCSMILCGVCCGMGLPPEIVKNLEIMRRQVHQKVEARKAAMDKTKEDVARKFARQLVVKIASCSKQIDCLLSQ